MTITMPSLTSHRRKASEAANATSSSRPPSHPMAKMAPIENDELTAVRAQSKHFAADLAAFATHMARISPRIPCSDLLLAPHYVDVKLGDVRRQVEGLRSRRAALRAALARSPAHARLEADQAAVARELDDKARELVVLTRQTKAVQQDLADEVRAARERGVDIRKDKEPPRSIDDAYLAVLAPKMLVPARVARGCARGVGLKALVFARYDALRSDCGGAHAHCCLLGLTTFAAVKPTYIVPPALQGEPLAHLLGVKEAVLTEPRNMLPLDRTVAKALREGLIVFAPAGPFEQTRVAWKCVVVDKSRANELGKNGRRWRVRSPTESPKPAYKAASVYELWGLTEPGLERRHPHVPERVPPRQPLPLLPLRHGLPRGLPLRRPGLAQGRHRRRPHLGLLRRVGPPLDAPKPGAEVRRRRLAEGQGLRPYHVRRGLQDEQQGLAAGGRG